MPNNKVFMFMSGVPYGDIGGGQQPAQYARQLVRFGHRVYHYQPCASWLCFADGVIEISCPSSMTDSFWSAGAKGAADHWTEIAAMPRHIGVEAWAIVCCPLTWYVRGAEILKAAGWRIAYFMIDDWERLYAMEGHDYYRRDEERRLLALADQIFVTAESLRYKTDRSATVIQNGYDENDFPFITKEKHDTVDHLSLVYWGSARGAWFDWELLVGISMLRPQWAFHIIGPIPPSPPRLQNVMYHGTAPTHWLSRLSRIGDVAIIPFKSGPAIDAVDPIKAYEYLACGLPVVSCRMPQIDGWPGVMQVPGVPVLWVEAIEAAAKQGVDPDKCAAHLRGRTWKDRVNTFLSVIDGTAGAVGTPLRKRGVKDAC